MRGKQARSLKKHGFKGGGSAARSLKRGSGEINLNKSRTKRKEKIAARWCEGKKSGGKKTVRRKSECSLWYG